MKRYWMYTPYFVNNENYTRYATDTVTKKKNNTTKNVNS